jgi:hypothetical protein
MEYLDPTFFLLSSHGGVGEFFMIEGTMYLEISPNKTLIEALFACHNFDLLLEYGFLDHLTIYHRNVDVLPNFSDLID